MRVADLLRLAISALWQQKMRTLLTTLGVILGSCLLTLSLSIGQGVQEAISKQFRKHDDLRRIQVYGGRRHRDIDETDIPPEAIAVQGMMSEEKRKRIRRYLVQQWQDHNVRRPPIPLNRETIERLERVPHVERIESSFFEQCQVTIGEQSILSSIHPTPIASRRYSRQIVAGAMPGSDDSRLVLVHEFLLYRLGLRDDAAVEAAIGKPLRLELRNEFRSPRTNLLMMFDAQVATLSNDELRLLEKAAKLLPEALSRLDLAPTERAKLQELLKRRDILTAPPTELTIAEEFTLAGVLRDLTPEEEKELPFYEQLFRFGEVFVPQRTAERLVEQLPQRRDSGYDGLTVLVDREEHVRSVVDTIREMGLEFYSAVDFVESVLREIRMIRFVTTFIAAAALLISGLGITNTMVTSVLERRREIGIMKAVGARDRDVQLVFLLEGALLGLIGAGMGLLIAWLVSIPGDDYARTLMAQQTRSEVEQQLFVFPWWLLLSVPLFVMLITTLAAFYPARRAARVDPIDALRHE